MSNRHVTKVTRAQVACRLGGVTDNDAELLAEAFNILTVRQLGKNKYFAVAVALAVLENAG